MTRAGQGGPREDERHDRFSWDNQPGITSWHHPLHLATLFAHFLRHFSRSILRLHLEGLGTIAIVLVGTLNRAIARSYYAVTFPKVEKAIRQAYDTNSVSIVLARYRRMANVMRITFYVLFFFFFIL